MLGSMGVLVLGSLVLGLAGAVESGEKGETLHVKMEMIISKTGNMIH